MDSLLAILTNAIRQKGSTMKSKSKNYLTLYYDKLDIVMNRLDDTQRGIWLAKIYKYETSDEIELTGDERIDMAIEFTIPDIKVAKDNFQDRADKARAAALIKHYGEDAATAIELYGLDKAMEMLKGKHADAPIKDDRKEDDTLQHNTTAADVEKPQDDESIPESDDAEMAERWDDIKARIGVGRLTDGEIAYTLMRYRQKAEKDGKDEKQINKDLARLREKIDQGRINAMYQR